jgi:transcription elongation factor Elf1
MKEWYWILIFFLIVFTAFLPAVLKAKCPKCGKRKIVQVEGELDTEEPYTYHFKCNQCEAQYKKVKSGPMEEKL